MGLPKTEIQRRTEAFEEFCRRRGLKATHQRREIFREVAGSETHPDAESVYQGVRRRVPTISRDTVYRTLSSLESEGLIRRTDSLGGPTRYDANRDQHHHFFCVVCGAIKDFASQPLDNLPLPETLAALGRVESAQVHVRGVCTECMQRERDKE